MRSKPHKGGNRNTATNPKKENRKNREQQKNIPSNNTKEAEEKSLSEIFSSIKSSDKMEKSKEKKKSVRKELKEIEQQLKAKEQQNPNFDKNVNSLVQKINDKKLKIDNMDFQKYQQQLGRKYEMV